MFSKENSLSEGPEAGLDRFAKSSYQGATVCLAGSRTSSLADPDPPMPNAPSTMRTFEKMPILKVTILFTMGVLTTPRIEAICYTKNTLLPIRKPVGADLFEIDPGAEVTRDTHPHVSSKQTTCKIRKTCLNLRKNIHSTI